MDTSGDIVEFDAVDKYIVGHLTSLRVVGESRECTSTELARLMRQDELLPDKNAQRITAKLRSLRDLKIIKYRGHKKWEAVYA